MDPGPEADLGADTTELAAELRGRRRRPLRAVSVGLGRLLPSPERPQSAAARVARGIAALVIFVVAVQRIFSPPAGEFFNGFATGCLYGLLGVGIVLIYRTNRIINFAAAGLGAVPGILCALLVSKQGWSWYPAFVLCLVIGAVLGALVDFLLIRRFANSPRLILTVVTIGLTQIFAFFGVEIPIWLGSKGKPIGMVTPFTYNWQFVIRNHIFSGVKQNFHGDYPFTIFLVVVTAALLALFLRYTRVGIALRASAENSDRAALLGIPVKRVQTVAWMMASVMGAIVIFQRSALVGVPSDGSLGPKVLLFALAAAVIGRMDSVPRTLVAGIGIGIVAEASVVKTGADSLSAAIMLAVILGALLLQRGRLSRAFDAATSNWQAVKEYRPIPRELVRLPEVVRFRSLLAVIVAAIFVGAPYVISKGEIGYLQLIVIYAIVAVSLVILTGWAGQISLGHLAIVGVGASVGGKLVAAHNVDFFVALAAGVAAGAVVSVLIGLPALRLPGLYLAVTTLAFGGAMEFYFLNSGYRIGKILTIGLGQRIRLPILWGRVVLTQPGTNGIVPGRPYYYLCLVFLALSLLMARAYRRNRAGRAVMAVRENQRAALSYSVNPARTKLGAFAVSGAIAAMAGVLLAYQSGNIDASTYGINASLTIFVVAVIGGLSSLAGAVYGVCVIYGITFFPGFFRDTLHIPHLDLLLTGPGLILTLLISPGGFAQGGYEIRDKFLRRVADRRGLIVPSLFADRRIETGEGEQDVVSAAEHSVETVESFDVRSEASIVCPTCGELLTIDAAVEHEHLRADRGAAVGAGAPAGPGDGRGGRRGGRTVGAKR